MGLRPGLIWLASGWELAESWRSSSLVGYFIYTKRFLMGPASRSFFWLQLGVASLVLPFWFLDVQVVVVVVVVISFVVETVAARSED